VAIGCIAQPMRAIAQGKTENAKKAEAPPVYPIVGEELIDPKQPLKPSFVINVSVANEPEPSGTYVIDPSGNIFLHVAEVLTPVPVNGHTPEQAADVLSNFLKKYIKDPKVTVSIVSIPRSTVNISGAVKISGTIFINGSSTLVDVLAKAEWLESADLSQVRLTRREMVNGKEKKTVATLHMDTYIRPDADKALDEKQNPVLQDKDSIFVPLKQLVGKGTFTVEGEVMKPAGGILLRTTQPLTLREAINAAGGVTPNGNRKAISVRRAGSPTMVLDLDMAEKDDPANNIEIKADDVVYVGRTTLTESVNVVGAVLKGGKFAYEKDMKLSQALIEAGGLLPTAKEKEISVVRPSETDAKKRIFMVNWRDIVTNKIKDIDLMPGDSIIVPGKLPSNGNNNWANILGPLGLLLRPFGL